MAMLRSGAKGVSGIVITGLTAGVICSLIGAGDVLPTTSALAQAPKAAVTTIESTDEARHIKKARALADEGRFDDAGKELRFVLDANPKNVEANYFLGYVLGRQGNYVASISREKNAIELDPKNAAAYAVLGLSLGSVRQYTEAAQALQESLRLDPTVARSYVNLAAIREKQGDFKSACSLYRRAISISPDYARAYLGLAEALGKQGDKLGKVEACKSAVKYAPKSAMAHAKLGIALSEAGDIGGSVREGFTANALKIQESWDEFLGTFLAAWGLVFLGFSLIFAVVFAGSRFKPQEGEKVLRSFFLTFYKDQPGRFVVTDSRLVFVPEIFSSMFGATRVSIQRAQIESIQYLSTMGGGTVSILTRDKSVHQFRMPILVLDPLRSLLVSQALAAGVEAVADSEAQTPAQSKSESESELEADAEGGSPAPAPVVPEIPAELEITEVDSENDFSEKIDGEKPEDGENKK
ncbi:MAG: tetratricopeptide repeat protein [Cyanobacteria bacterium SZAS LIN-3]|nr:tetratricopeptide repeat protein [Cyanobacteria bacterium SZAS LIN-3]